MAENDFKDIGISDVIGKSIDAIRNLVELIKHKKGNLDWKNENHKIEERDGGYFVLIKNDNGQVIYIPVEQYEWFKDMPKKSLEKWFKEWQLDRIYQLELRRMINLNRLKLH